jgi:8-oxo-dGTP diphosphatase
MTEPAGSFRIGVFAIIMHDGRVLLARRRDIGWWNLPGGGMERGETVDEALRREVREEIGLEVAIVRLTGVYSKPQKDEVVLTFLCHPAGGEPGASAEISEVGFFPPYALPERTLPKHRERVADAFLHQPEAIIRAQRTSTAEDQREPAAES